MLQHFLKARYSKTAQLGAVTIATLASSLASPVYAGSLWSAGDLVVSGSYYEGTTSTVTIGQTLPGGGIAIADGSYPNVFKNESVDPSFGVTSPIFISDVNPTTGAVINTTNVTALAAASGQQLVTSFPSKSEESLNFTPSGTLTFIDYATTVNQLDVSNANTPGIIEPGNPVTTTPTYREVAQLNPNSSLQLTTTNAYPGNNGRAAILANGLYYTVGNGGNGNGSSAVTSATGVQIVVPGQNATSATPGTNPVGQYNITQNGYSADKTAKDNNFRGETIYNNTLYVTKGSGSNGINTVYQVGNAGSLPTLANSSLTSPTINILPGFPTNLAKNPIATGTAAAIPFANITYPGAPFVPNNPFGIWFANPTTLYVADEGSDSTTSTGTIDQSKNVFGGLEKWSLVNGTWQPDYILQNGLNLGTSYTVNESPTCVGSLTTACGGNGTYTTATEGLRDLAGKVNADGTVTLYAITSTISAATDQGADPNELVAITDLLSATTLPTTESFTTLQTAAYGQVLRGVALAPVPTPEYSSGGVVAGVLVAFGFITRKCKK